MEEILHHVLHTKPYKIGRFSISTAFPDVFHQQYPCQVDQCFLRKGAHGHCPWPLLLQVSQLCGLWFLRQWPQCAQCGASMPTCTAFSGRCNSGHSGVVLAWSRELETPQSFELCSGKKLEKYEWTDHGGAETIDAVDAAVNYYFWWPWPPTVF